MTAWSSNELEKIGKAEELKIAPRRKDGTLRNPIPIWVVRLDDGLYVRSYNGQSGSWFRAIQNTGEGQIQAGGVEKDVQFMEVDANQYNQIDSAYQKKYGRYPQYVKPMLTADVQSTTLRLVPKQSQTV